MPAHRALLLAVRVDGEHALVTLENKMLNVAAWKYVCFICTHLKLLLILLDPHIDGVLSVVAAGLARQVEPAALIPLPLLGSQ